MKKMLTKLAVILVTAVILQLTYAENSEALIGRCFSPSCTSLVLQNVSVNPTGHEWWLTENNNVLDFGLDQNLFGGTKEAFSISNFLPTINLDLGALNTIYLENFSPDILTTMSVKSGSLFSLNYTAPVGTRTTGLLEWNVRGSAYSIEIAQAPVPEPSTVALLGIGLVGLVAVKRRKRVKE